jgi:hypothetical protein
LTSFVCLFPFKIHSTSPFWLEIFIRAEILGVYGNSRLLTACVHHRDLQKALPFVSRVVLAITHFCATIGSAVPRLREKNLQKIKNKKKNYQKKKATKRYISLCMGGALIQLLAMEVGRSV